MSYKNLRHWLASFAVGMVVLAGCNRNELPDSFNPGDYSTKTLIPYTDNEEGEEGKFTVRDYEGQPQGPDLVFIQGGRHILGTMEEDVLGSLDHVERTVTVSSFYMDQTEIANIHWLEYLHFVQDSGQQYYEDALPDTTVWAKELAFNDPYVDHYFRYPGFRYFPVVGISWIQAQNYCKWRTQVVNKQLALENGSDNEQSMAENGERIPLESGIVVPDFRLPTEAEWEYAAYGLVGLIELDENQSNRRIYPWDGHSLRNPFGPTMGSFLANFKRGRGDYAGLGGRLNDAAMITDEVYAYPPNDFGLYNMAGNVNEWVEDLYRPLTFEDVDDLNPVRKSGFLDNPDYGYYYDKATNFNTMIDDHVRVYKGGSWKDVAYWLSPGTRRYLEEDSATATIGFRCAMIRAGRNN